MGLTIHYSFRTNLRSAKHVRERLTRLHSRAMDLPFEQVEEIIELKGGECNYEHDDRKRPHRWMLIQSRQHIDDPQRTGYSYSVSPKHLLAFSTWPGEGCEQANFGLCRYPAVIEIDDPVLPSKRRRIRTGLAGWRWGSFCKTHYASNPECGGLTNFLRCHLAVVRLLDVARSVGFEVDVCDESDYWEHQNIESLAHEMGEWNAAVAEFAERLHEQLGGAPQASKS